LHANAVSRKIPFVSDRRASRRWEQNPGHSLVAFFLCLAFAFALALSVSPQLHAQVHNDAGTAHHVCFVTLIGAGNCEDVPMACTFINVGPLLVSSDLPRTLSAFLPSLFLESSVLEHAPPVIS